MRLMWKQGPTMLQDGWRVWPLLDDDRRAIAGRAAWHTIHTLPLLTAHLDFPLNGEYIGKGSKPVEPNVCPERNGDTITLQCFVERVRACCIAYGVSPQGATDPSGCVAVVSYAHLHNGGRHTLLRHRSLRYFHTRARGQSLQFTVSQVLP